MEQNNVKKGPTEWFSINLITQKTPVCSFQPDQMWLRLVSFKLHEQTKCIKKHLRLEPFCTMRLLEVLCFQWNHSHEIIEISKKCFGESILSLTQVFECRKAFSKDCEFIENLPLLVTHVPLLMTITSKGLKKQCLKIVALASER